MEMLHDTWLAALGVPNADDVRETEEAQGHLEETPTDEFRGGKLTNFAAGAPGRGPKYVPIFPDHDYSQFELDSYWKILLGGANPVEVNGVSLRNPVFVTMDQERNFMDVAPHQVGRDGDGFAMSLKGDGGPDTANLSYNSTFDKLPLTPSRYAVKGDFWLWGRIPAKMVTFVDKFGGGIYEIVEPLFGVTLETILTGVSDFSTGVSLKHPVLTFQSKKKGSTEPGLYLSCEILPKGPLQPVADTLKDVFRQEDPAIKVAGQLAKKRDWEKAPVPIEFTLRAQLLKLSVKLGGIIVITDMGVEVTGTRTPGSKKKKSDDGEEEDSTNDGKKKKKSDDAEEDDSTDDGKKKKKSDDGTEKKNWDDGDYEDYFGDSGNSKHKRTGQFFSTKANLPAGGKHEEKSTDDGKGDDSVDPEKAKYEFSAGFSGSGGITVPGSSLPLRVKWLLKKEGKVYKLTLDMGEEEWKDVLGVRGLSLENVKFDASFSTKDIAALSLGIHGRLRCGSKVITVDGSYDSKGNWMIEGKLKDVDLTLLEDFYEHVFGTQLNDIRSRHKLEFGRLDLLVKHDSKTGGTLTFEGEVHLNGYTSANATITLSSLGLEIKGNVENIKFETFIIERATIAVLISPKNAAGFPYRASINGIVTIEGVTIMVGLYVDALKKDPLWTVYGEIEDLKLSKFGSAIKDTFLDLELMKVAVIASNREQPKEGVKKEGEGPNRFNYPVKKGLQVWAKVTKVDAVSKVTRTAPVELELCLVYEEGKSLTVDIVLPTKGAINFSKSVYSGEITLEAVISNDPHISISAGLFVKVHTQADPLELEFTLTAKEVSAKGTASLRGMWKDPFGISPKVQVGKVFLGVEILYAEFFETGIPKSITFGGDLIVGSTEGKLMVKVDENPENELVVVDITNLDLADFIDFARDVTQKEIPQIPHKEVLYLRKVNIQYAMTDVTVDKKEYSQGLDMDCDVDVFRHNMKVKANIHKESGISIQGCIQRFHLGPLELTGSKKNTDADLEIKINKETQKIFIDGAVTLFDDIYASSYVDVGLRPKPVFHFTMKLQFGQVLEFDLEANMIGEIAGANTKDLDFKLSADFRQEIVDYIANEAAKYISSFHEVAQGKLEEEKKQLEADKKAADEGLQNALADLKKAEEDWDQKRNEVIQAFEDKQKYVHDRLEDLRKVLNEARIAFNKVVDAFENALETARHYWAGAIDTAESAITSAAHEAEQGLEKARRTIADAQRELHSAFGDVDRAITAAQTDVNNAQWVVNQKEKEIAAKDKQIDDAGIFEKPGLYIELGVLKAEKLVLAAALGIASAALHVAKDVLNDFLYKKLNGALEAAKQALGDTEKEIEKAAKSLNEKLKSVKKEGENALRQAKEDLEDAKTKGAAAKAFQKAQDGLTAFEKDIDKIVHDVKDAVDNILKTAEYLAFTAAELAVKGWYDLINVTLEARRLLLEAEDKGEKLVNKIMNWLVNEGKTIFNVKEVKISGELRAMLSDKELMAKIHACVGGVECTLWVSFPIGKVEQFLESLWKAVLEKLKELFERSVRG